MTHSEVLRGGTLALVKTKPDVLKTFVGLAERAIQALARLRLGGNMSIR